MPRAAQPTSTPVVAEVLEALRTTFGVARASLWVTNAARSHSLRCAVGHLASEPSPLGLILPPRAGLVGAVSESKAPLAVKNATFARDHVDVSNITGFSVGGVLSLPIILKGEAWGVLQLVEPIPRTWKRGEISRAQNHVDQLRISLLERFIATGSNFPEGLLATILTTGSGRSSIRTVEGTVLCLDLIKSRELLLDDTVHHPHVLASMTGYFEAAIRIAETFDGRVVGTAGDALVFFFEGGTQALREQRAISCLREIAEQFAKRRNESAVDVGMLGVPPQSGRTLWFHGAIASGSIEVGLLPSRAGPVLCSLGNPLHTAFAMTKEIGLHVDPEVIQVPGVAVV